MLKTYEWRGLTYQFEEGKQPFDAVEVKKAEPKNKEAAPQNKTARRTRK